MSHPDTYLNKVVIGSQEGKLQLWNFATGKMLYEFAGLGYAAVQCIAPSPALDVVGLGMSDGWVVLLQGCFTCTALLTCLAAVKQVGACCFDCTGMMHDALCACHPCTPAAAACAYCLGHILHSA